MEQTTQSAYEILEVSRNASFRQIKRAFRRLALRYHPDRNPDDPEADEKFKRARWAYDALMSGTGSESVSPEGIAEKFRAESFMDTSHPFYSFFSAVKAHFEKKCKDHGLQPKTSK